MGILTCSVMLMSFYRYPQLSIPPCTLSSFSSACTVIVWIISTFHIASQHKLDYVVIISKRCENIASSNILTAGDCWSAQTQCIDLVMIWVFVTKLGTLGTVCISKIQSSFGKYELAFIDHSIYVFIIMLYQLSYWNNYCM